MNKVVLVIGIILLIVFFCWGGYMVTIDTQKQIDYCNSIGADNMDLRGNCYFEGKEIKNDR